MPTFLIFMKKYIIIINILFYPKYFNHLLNHLLNLLLNLLLKLC